MSLNIISRILNHKTAPNLFLMLMIFLGLFAAKQLNTQFFLITPLIIYLLVLNGQELAQRYRGLNN